MTHIYQNGSVSNSGMFDMTFLNPFISISKNNKEFMVGTRFGNAQFIYIICAIISLVLIGFLSDDINKTLILISLVIYYIFLYYNLSCYLIPDNHERCFLLAWICIITVIFITLIVLFHENLFNIKSKKENSKVKGGKHCKKCKDKKSKKEKVGGDSDEEKIESMNNQKGNGLYHSNTYYELEGGGNCNSHNEEEKITGGGNCNSHNEEEKITGGGNCNSHNEEEKITGGGNCNSHNEEEKITGGGNCNTKQEEIMGGYNSSDIYYSTLEEKL
jgi:hypothetical protein